MIYRILILLASCFCSVAFATQEGDKSSQAVQQNDSVSVQAVSTPSVTNDKSVLPGKRIPGSVISSNTVASQKQEIISQGQDVTGSLLQVTLGLIVVLIVIGGAAWFARRFGKFNVSAKGNLRIVGGLQMGARERVVLMQVGDQQLLLGVAPGSVQTLHVLNQPLESDIPGATSNAQGENPLNRFGAILNKVQNR